MKQAESKILNAVKHIASLKGCKLYRNHNGAYQTRLGQWLSFGLGKGTSDLIGYRSIFVSAGMVGKRFAQFVAFECKTDKGIASKEQKDFVNEVKFYGGISGIIHNPEEAIDILDGKL